MPLEKKPWYVNDSRLHSEADADVLISEEEQVKEEEAAIDRLLRASNSSNSPKTVTRPKPLKDF